MNIHYYIFRDIFWDISSYFAYKSHLWHAQISWILVNTPIFLFVDVFLYTPIFMSGWRLAGATCLSESAFVLLFVFTMFHYISVSIIFIFYYVLLYGSSSSFFFFSSSSYYYFSRILAHTPWTCGPSELNNSPSWPRSRLRFKKKQEAPY